MGLDALVYFYPKGDPGKSKAGYCASDVQIQILSDIYKHNDERIKFEWICGDGRKSQTCSIRKYIEPNTERLLGFHTLFSIQHIKKHRCVIRITCNLQIKETNICHIESQTELSKEDNIEQPSANINKTRKRKANQPLIFDFPAFKRIKSNKKKQNQARNDWKLSSKKLMDAIKDISDKLGHDTLLKLLPTIDCFPSLNANSNNKHQPICDHYISEKNGFFTSKYDLSAFWSGHVAWCDPPNDRKIIVATMNLFKTRKMRGYCCVPIWKHEKRKSYIHFDKYKYVGDAKKACKTYTNLKAVAYGKNDHDWTLDVLVFYYDYQNK